MSNTDAADAPTPDATESITIYSDYVCPFCYLGRQSFARYQETREEPLAIDWHPFDLRAGKRGPDGEIDDTADDGKDEEYYEQARENVRRLQEKYDAEMAQELRTDVDSLPAQIVSVHVRDRARVVARIRRGDIRGAVAGRSRHRRPRGARRHRRRR